MARESASMGQLHKGSRSAVLGLDHAGNYHKQRHAWPKKRKRAAWTTLFTGLLEATLPMCAIPEDRLFFQQFILDRVVVVRSGQSYHYKPASSRKSGALIAECLEWLAREGEHASVGNRRASSDPSDTGARAGSPRREF